MNLKTIDFILHKIPPLNDWVLKPIRFGNLNLIIGKNATGKSKLIELIIKFCEMFSTFETKLIGSYGFSFEQKNKKLISYKCIIRPYKSSTIVTKEELKIGNIQIFKRYRNQLKLRELLLDNSQDLKKLYGFDSKELFSWMSKIYVLRFGHLHSYETNKKSSNFEITFKMILDFLKNMDEENRKKIVEDFNSLGYKVSYIKVNLFENEYNLFLKEEHLNYEIKQNEMSQGMLRTFSLVVLIHYLHSKNESLTFIIDDLGEGLDYERARKLGKLVFENLKGSKIQLIATSNDSFLIDSIDIENLTVLQRSTNVIKSFNIYSHKELFDKFDYTGLSNFDLLSSNFIDVQ